MHRPSGDGNIKANRVMKRAGFKMLTMGALTFMAIVTPLAAKAEPTNSAAGGAERKSGATLVEPAEAAKLIADKKVVVLDVRMPPEFAKGHIAGATNLDIYNKDFKANLAKLDKSQPYLVHCAVGMRSAKACRIM